MTTDRINLADAVLERSPDVRAWPISVAIVGVKCTPERGFEIAFGRPIPDTWKWPSNPAVPSENFQYTVWLFALLGGVWHGAGFVQMWQGRDFNRAVPPLFQDVDGAPGYTRLWGDVRKLWGALSDYVPANGDKVGIMVTAGNGRLTDGVTSVAERSQVVLFPVQNDTGSMVFFDDPAGGTTDPPVNPPATQPTSDVQLDTVLLALGALKVQRLQDRADILDAIAHLEAEVLKAATSSGHAPNYTGTVKLPYYGTVMINLKPQA